MQNYRKLAFRWEKKYHSPWKGSHETVIKMEPPADAVPGREGEGGTAPRVAGGEGEKNPSQRELRSSPADPLQRHGLQVVLPGKDLGREKILAGGKAFQISILLRRPLPSKLLYTSSVLSIVRLYVQISLGLGQSSELYPWSYTNFAYHDPWVRATPFHSLSPKPFAFIHGFYYRKKKVLDTGNIFPKNTNRNTA
jgi:hypothetical protein